MTHPLDNETAIHTIYITIKTFFKLEEKHSLPQLVVNQSSLYVYFIYKVPVDRAGAACRAGRESAIPLFAPIVLVSRHE